MRMKEYERERRLQLRKKRIEAKAEAAWLGSQLTLGFLPCIYPITTTINILIWTEPSLNSSSLGLMTKGLITLQLEEIIKDVIDRWINWFHFFYTVDVWKQNGNSCEDILIN